MAFRKLVNPSHAVAAAVLEVSGDRRAIFRNPTSGESCPNPRAGGDRKVARGALDFPQGKQLSAVVILLNIRITSYYT